MEYCTLMNAKRSAIFKYITGILSGIFILVSLYRVITYIDAFQENWNDAVYSNWLFAMIGELCFLAANVLFSFYIWAIYGKRRLKFVIALSALALAISKAASVTYGIIDQIENDLWPTLMETVFLVTEGIISLIFIVLFVLLLFHGGTKMRQALKITVIVLLACVLFDSILIANSMQSSNEILYNQGGTQNNDSYYGSFEYNRATGSVDSLQILDPVVGDADFNTLYSDPGSLPFIVNILLYLPLCLFLLFCHPGYIQKSGKKIQKTAEELGNYLQFLKMKYEAGVLSEEEYAAQKKAAIYDY